MKLYEIPRNSKIKLEEGMSTFHHLDWAYSFCTADWMEENDDNRIFHLSASTPLKKEWDYYVIDNLK